MTSSRVDHVIRRGGAAVGVRTADGVQYGAARAVLADCDARTCSSSWWRRLDRPGGRRAAPDVPALVRHVQGGLGTAGSGAVAGTPPCTAPGRCTSPTAWTSSMTAAQLAMGRIPDRPFLVAGQMTTADPARSPAGTESLWAYTHVPQEVRGDAGPDGLDGRWDDAQRQRFAHRMEERIERLAPGFRSSIIARHVMAPADLESRSRTSSAATSAAGPHSSPAAGVARSLAGAGPRPASPACLASASAHPGGGVHGGVAPSTARATLRARSPTPRPSPVGAPPTRPRLVTAASHPCRATKRRKRERTPPGGTTGPQADGQG
ncbi:MAG: hypothetical protein R2713_15535 [Ilumatobacteraceae bacterium]